MTLMIPSKILRSKTPKGERQLFKLLQTASGTENWIALHSFYLARHDSKQEGEVDMILLIPDLGIIFIEVKGCGVKRINGEWIYSDGRASDDGPFVQASSAMHSVRKAMAKKSSDFRGLCFTSMAIFTEIQFDVVPEPLEWHEWQFADKKKLARDRVYVFEDALRKCHQHYAFCQRRDLENSSGKRKHSWYDPVNSRPSSVLCEQLAEALRPNFSAPAGSRRAIEFIEDEIDSYTAEQISILDALQDNPRTLVTGPAGTGKTVIAMEAFYRALGEKKNVYFVCFNRLLAADYKAKLEADGSQLSENSISTFHNLLLKVSGCNVPSEADERFWKVDLPDLALGALLEGSPTSEFFAGTDLVIIDEAQDLMLPQYLDCLEAMLDKPLNEAEWLILGDFKNQDIYSGDFSIFERRAQTYARYSLTKNCRNVGQIAAQINLLFNVDPPYKKTLEFMDGGFAGIEVWSSQQSQANAFCRLIRKYTETFLNHEIIVLSSRKHPDYLNLVEPEIGRLLAPIEKITIQHGPKIRYTTISAFKGLESPVVIITDVDDLSSKSLSLLYVAISRAKICVTVLLHEKMLRKWEALLEEGFKR